MLIVFQRFFKKLSNRVVKRKVSNFKNFGKLEYFSKDLDGKDDNSGI